MVIKTILISVFISMLACSCSVTESLKNDIHIQQTKANNVQLNYHQILILADGSQIARVFFENLNEQLTKSLNSKNIHNTYFFLGTNLNEVDKNLKDVITKQKFDAILFFSPKDTSKVKENNDDFGIQLRSIKLNQTFNINVYDNGNIQHPICSAVLMVNCNFTKHNVYLTISSDLVRFLEQNKLWNIKNN